MAAVPAMLLQAYLGDIAGWVPDHRSQATTTVKGVVTSVKRNEARWPCPVLLTASPSSITGALR